MTRESPAHNLPVVEKHRKNDQEGKWEIKQQDGRKPWFEEFIPWLESVSREETRPAFLNFTKSKFIRADHMFFFRLDHFLFIGTSK